MNNGNVVVEVHKSEKRDRLFYRVGKLTSEISWNENHDYDDGVSPSVAITNDGLVVEVHKSQNHDTLWYQVGRVDNDVITGFSQSPSQSKQYNSNGTVPKVACNEQSTVETHSNGTKLFSSILTLPAFRPQSLEERGPKSYYYFFMGSGFGPVENERIATNNTLRIDAGAPFLIANLTQSRDSIAFPPSAMLTIQAPDGTLYNQEESRGFIQVVKAGQSGTSLQSLMIKEPIAGEYRITLTLPPNVAFFFEFQTLPFGYLNGIIEGAGNQELQKRDVDGDKEKRIAAILAMTWLMISRENQSLSLLEESVGYVTKSEVDLTESKVPTDLGQATDIIAFPAYRILTIEDFRRPPDPPTPAPVNGPVLEYVQNVDGALFWLHARIRRVHLGTGTPTNQRIRNFAQRLGLRTDDAGHVIGNQLGGLGTVEWNIFPQNPNFNRGVYARDVERVFRDAVERYGDVEVWFRFHYDDANHPTRVLSFDFCMLLPDGTVEINDLYNPYNV